jgi:hypothetical protein
VLRRLTVNPRLVPLASAAADARISRKRTGKTLAIIGFVLLGVGDIAGSAIIVSTPGYPNVESGHEDRIVAGLAVAGIGLGVGLALAIPGLVKMGRESEDEKRLREAYSPPPPRFIGSQDLHAQVLGRTFVTPVFSTTF